MYGDLFQTKNKTGRKGFIFGGAVLFIMGLTDLYSGAIYITLSPVMRKTSPILFWVIVASELIAGVFFFIKGIKMKSGINAIKMKYGIKKSRD